MDFYDTLANNKEVLLDYFKTEKNIKKYQKMIEEKPLNPSLKYKTGVVSGKFRLLHKGHKELFIQASGLCEKLHVIIDADEKHERYTSVLELKQAIGKIFQSINIPNTNFDIHVISKQITDTLEWDKKVLELVPECQVIFNSKEDYPNIILHNEFLTLNEKAEQVVFASVLEKDIYKTNNFNLLAKEYQPYLNKKVVITGIESCGKTTLTHKLSAVFDTNQVSEEYGKYHSDKFLGGIENTFRPSDFIHIAAQQMLQDKEKNIEASRILFVDTDPLVTLYYLDLYNQDILDENEINEYDVIAAKETLASYVKNYKCDLFIYLEPKVPYVADGKRWNEEKEKRELLNKKLKKMYNDFGIQFEIVSSENYNDRLREATEIIEDVLKIDRY